MRVLTVLEGADFARGVAGADGAGRHALFDVEGGGAAVADEEDALVEAALFFAGEVADCLEGGAGGGHCGGCVHCVV